MNRSTFRWKTSWLRDLISPSPQNSEGIRRERTARQNEETIAFGVAWSIIEVFRRGIFVVLIIVDRIEHLVLADICVANLVVDPVLCSGCGIKHPDAWSTTWMISNCTLYYIIALTGQWYSSRILYGHLPCWTCSFRMRCAAPPRSLFGIFGILGDGYWRFISVSLSV